MFGLLNLVYFQLSIEAVLVSMTDHAGEVTVQRIACGAILNIAFDAQNQTSVITTGGIQTLLTYAPST